MSHCCYTWSFEAIQFIFQKASVNKSVSTSTFCPGNTRKRIKLIVIHLASDPAHSLLQNKSLIYGSRARKSGIVKSDRDLKENKNEAINDVFSTDISVVIQRNGACTGWSSNSTGSWFNPAFPGRGGFINIADGDGGSVFVVSWFGYETSTGNQLWLIGSMPFEDGVEEVTIPMETTRLDRNGNVLKKNWGSFSFEFDSCNSGRLITEPNGSNSGGSQTIPLTRLTKIVDMSC